MILVDTSVWVEHLRFGRRDMSRLLQDGQVRCHPFVIGELACGVLRPQDAILDTLSRLPSIDVVDHGEAMALLANRGWAGSGLGWIDVHLLASALVAGVKLWTLDQRMAAAARSLRLAIN